MEIKNKMRYFITDRLGTYEVFPMGESEYSISYDRQNDEQLDYDVSLDGKMLFVKEAFNRLMSFEGGGYRCEEMILSVKKDCTSGLVPIRAFSISLNEGSFDLDKCSITMKVLKDSKDKCISDNKTNKVNLLNLIGTGLRVAVKPFSAGGGVYEYRTCQKSQMVNDGDSFSMEVWCTNGGGLPTDNTTEAYDNNWLPMYQYVRMDGSINGNPLPGGLGASFYKKMTWVREIVTINCADTPDPDWILVQDNCSTDNTKKYAKKAELYGCQYINQDYTDNWNYYWTYQCNLVGSSGNNGFPTIDNGILLKDALIELVKSACPALTVKSDFFQINPDNPSATNYVTNKESTTNQIVLFQKSDVKRPTVTNNATKFEVNFEKFTEILKFLFNVKWRIEGSFFRIEHVSYYGKTVGIDVVNSPKLLPYFKGKRVYSYESEKIPQKEIFDFKERGYNPDWNTTIEYTGCVTNNKDNVVNFIVDEATTDVAYCLANPDSDSNNVADEGFVIVSTKKVGTEYFMRSENSPNGGRIMNNVFAFDMLVRDFHHYDRPMKTGKVDGTITTFETSIPTKKGDKFSIPLCVCDGIFDPDNLINTPLGEGIVSSATWRFKDQILELDLLYESNQDLTYNLPPTLTGGGNYYTYLNIPKVIPITATDPDGFIQAVNVNYAPLNGTITIDPSFTFITYTPNTGFTGLDYFALVALDNFSEPSNIENFAVTVRTANNPPVAVNDEYDYYIGSPWAQGNSILANDSDDWNSATIITTSVTTAQGVAITIDALGFFDYTPPSGFVGDDSFSYTIEDDLGQQSTATVTIHVRNYHYPIANTDYYTCKINTVLGVDGTLGKPKLVANDTTPDGITYTYTATTGTFATTQGGSVTIASDGSFTYTPPSGFTGQDHFTYTVSNGVGTDVGDVYIEVIPALYVQIIKSFPTNTPNIIECGDPPMASIGGQTRTRDFSVKFWADSAKTIPYDTTGKHIHVILQESTTTQNYPNPPFSYAYDWATDEVNGTEYMIYDNWEFYVEWLDCNGFPNYSYEMDLAVQSAQWYTVVF